MIYYSSARHTTHITHSTRNTLHDLHSCVGSGRSKVGRFGWPLWLQWLHQCNRASRCCEGGAVALGLMLQWWWSSKRMNRVVCYDGNIDIAMASGYYKHWIFLLPISFAIFKLQALNISASNINIIFISNFQITNSVLQYTLTPNKSTLPERRCWLQ